MGDYKNWSHEGLIHRVEQLERELKEKNESIAQHLSHPSTSPNLFPPPKFEKKPKRPPTVFDPSKYSTRLIALKLSYLGKDYNGFEHHINNITPLPTIEEELWAALTKACFIFPKTGDQTANSRAEGGERKGIEVNWEGCEYSKCGRTDKGVSAFGQVIGIRVRSNRPLERPKSRRAKNEEDPQGSLELETRAIPSSSSPTVPVPPDGPFSSSIDELSSLVEDEDTDYSNAVDFDHIKDELPYATVLNKLLPPTIRILAWCPSPPPDFSARFSCRERQYRYFFTQPAFAPSPLPLQSRPVSSQLSSPSPSKITSPRSGSETKVPDGWLDISAMRKAAKYFEGSNDFRNFCKIDGGKQIENFHREIFKADIEEVDPKDLGAGYAFTENFLPASIAQSSPAVSGENMGTDVRKEAKIYTFTLHGSAFLWHQVRHMVAILFLVGQGLEEPELVQRLLDISQTPERPGYEMASDTPLVLWDCIFSQKGDAEGREALNWLYVGDDEADSTSKFSGNGALMDELWRVWRSRKVDEVLAGSLMGLVARQGRHNALTVPNDVNCSTKAQTWDQSKKGGKSKYSQKVFDGSDMAKPSGTYVPVEKKPKLDSPEVVNERFARRKGFTGSKEMREVRGGVGRVGTGSSGEVLDNGGD